MRELPVKHVSSMTRLPEKATDFTTGQKLALAAGIFDAVANFTAAKEITNGSGET